MLRIFVWPWRIMLIVWIWFLLRLVMIGRFQGAHFRFDMLYQQGHSWSVYGLAFHPDLMRWLVCGKKHSCFRRSCEAGFVYKLFTKWVSFSNRSWWRYIIACLTFSNYIFIILFCMHKRYITNPLLYTYTRLVYHKPPKFILFLLLFWDIPAHITLL